MTDPRRIRIDRITVHGGAGAGAAPDDSLRAALSAELAGRLVGEWGDDPGDARHDAVAAQVADHVVAAVQRRRTRR